MCELVTQRAPRFTPQRCARKLEAIEDEVAALDRMQSASLVLASPRQATGGRPAPALGAKEPRLTLVEFSDFTCSDCRRSSLIARMVERLYGDEVRFVFRQFPRSTNPEAQLAAEASLAAHAQGRFWRYHDILFANPHDLSRAALLRYADEAGLDRAAFEAALADGRYRKDVESDLALGRDVFVAGPPALFVDGKQVTVPFGVAELSGLIEDAKRGRSAGVAGVEPGRR